MDYRFPADLQPFVDEMIAKGTYPDVHALILDAVYRHRDYELTRQRKYEELKKDIQVGLDELDRGEVVDGPEFFDRLLGRLGSGETKREAS